MKNDVQIQRTAKERTKTRNGVAKNNQSNVQSKWTAKVRTKSRNGVAKNNKCAPYSLSTRTLRSGTAWMVSTFSFITSKLTHSESHSS